MIGRARAIAIALACAATPFSASGCGRAPAESPRPPPIQLHLEPACDLAPAAGLRWLVEVKPRAIAEIADLIPVVARVVPEARFTTFASSHGGVDPRRVQDLCIAQYTDSRLTVARVPFDPARVERAFAQRVTREGGRRIELARPPVVRLWGEVNGEALELEMFGDEAIALEEGRAGPLRAASAFAQGKLKRARPALRSGSLSDVVRRLGDAPFRAFAPGPFEGEMAQALGGLMRASTAFAVSVSYAGASTRLAVRVVLTGAWGAEAPRAAERLAAAVHVVAESPLGRLLGVDHPVVAPHVESSDDALVLTTTVDGIAFGRGLHDALDAEIAEIMRR